MEYTNVSSVSIETRKGHQSLWRATVTENCELLGGNAGTYTWVLDKSSKPSLQTQGLNSKTDGVVVSLIMSPAHSYV